MENEFYFNGKVYQADQRQDMTEHRLVRTTDGSYAPLESLALHSYHRDRIAEAVYGSRDAPQIAAFVQIKKKMKTMWAGRLILDLYNRNIQAVADLVETNPEPVRRSLDWLLERYSN
jgi:hypothetical protein